MRKLAAALAIAAVGGLTSLAASATPPVGGGGLALIGGSPVHYVHGWHCGTRTGRFLGYKKRRHRHLEACRDRLDDDDYGYNGNDGYRRSDIPDYSYARRGPARPAYSRYRRPLYGPDLHRYFRLKLGKDGWGGGG